MGTEKKAHGPRSRVMASAAGWGRDETWGTWGARVATKQEEHRDDSPSAIPGEAERHTTPDRAGALPRAALDASVMATLPPIEYPTTTGCSSPICKARTPKASSDSGTSG